MDPSAFRSDPHANRPSIADREVVRTARGVHAGRVTEAVGARFDALMGDDESVAIDRPSGAIDLLLSGWCVPYDAEIDGGVVPVSCEASWWVEQRAAGRGSPLWSSAPPLPGRWTMVTDEERGESARSARASVRHDDFRT